ncbi:MAG: hypothetical protein ACYS32_11630 [Planctomycetota bacterium]
MSWRSPKGQHTLMDPTTNCRLPDSEKAFDLYLGQLTPKSLQLQVRKVRSAD